MCNTRKGNPCMRAEEASEEEALDDEFLMYRYKVVPCTRRYPHDWACCPCGHKGERASRRDLKTHPYAAIACIHAKQRQTCPKGDSCPHAHNLFEYWLHPQRYRTELCQFGSSCERPVCFFAHSFDELRLLDARLPPAETCWSAGAAVSANSRAQAASSQQQQQQVVGAGAAAAFAEAAAAAAAAAQMQATVWFGSGLQQLHAAQVPAGSLGMASTASQGSMLLLQQQQQQQQQLMFTAGSGQNLPLQLQESPVQALLPTVLTAPNLWPGSCGSLAAAAAAPVHIPEAACSSSSNTSSSWSTSSMVDCSIIHISPAAAASSMPCLTATMLASSCPHRPASLQPQPIPATAGGTSRSIWAAQALAGTPPAPQPRQQQPAHPHTIAGILSAMQELQLRHHA